MIRNEVFVDGVCIEAEIIDLEAGTFAVEKRGKIRSTRPLTLEERAMYAPAPLDAVGVLATLLVVNGSLSAEDAAAAVGVSPDHLVHEALAWSAASE